MIDEKNIKRSKRGLYGDVVEELDSSVGKILKTLKELGIDNNTFVIFTSDNGPWGWRGVNGGSASLLKGNKGSVYEGGYRVPAIAWMPGSIDEGITTQSVCSTLDLYPTIMSIAGAKDSSVMGIIGTDISKTFFQNLPVYNNIHYYRQDTLVALRHEEWKIYVNDPDPWNDEYTISDLPLLFNLNHDPSEKYNLSDKNPKIIEKLKQLVDDHLQSVEVNKSQLNEILPTYKKAYDAYNKKS